MRAFAWSGTLLAIGSLALAVPAWAPAESKPDGGLVRKPEPKPPPASTEDQEVVKNLELLENLDESRDLDLMQELTH